MSAIAGQTAGQIGLKLFQETQGYSGGNRLKKIYFFN